MVMRKPRVAPSATSEKDMCVVWACPNYGHLCEHGSDKLRLCDKHKLRLQRFEDVFHAGRYKNVGRQEMEAAKQERSASYAALHDAAIRAGYVWRDTVSGRKYIDLKGHTVMVDDSDLSDRRPYWKAKEWFNFVDTLPAQPQLTLELNQPSAPAEETTTLFEMLTELADQFTIFRNHVQNELPALRAQIRDLHTEVNDLRAALEVSTLAPKPNLVLNAWKERLAQ